MRPLYLVLNQHNSNQPNIICVQSLIWYEVCIKMLALYLINVITCNIYTRKISIPCFYFKFDRHPSQFVSQSQKLQLSRDFSTNPNSCTRGVVWNSQSSGYISRQETMGSWIQVKEAHNLPRPSKRAKFLLPTLLFPYTCGEYKRLQCQGRDSASQ